MRLCRFGLPPIILGYKLGMVDSDALSKDELQLKLGKSGKITSTRLGELIKNGSVQKTSDEKFRMTTMGVVQTQKEIIPKIKSKMKSLNQRRKPNRKNILLGCYTVFLRLTHEFCNVNGSNLELAV